MPVGPWYVDSVSPSSSPEVGVAGRGGQRDRAGVRDVGEQRAEHDHHADVELVGDVDELGDERPPADVRLDAPHQHDVAAPEHLPGHRDLRGRPGQVALAVGADAHERAVDLEVVVVLRVERGERLGAPDLLEVGDRAGRGVAGVVPALERGDHHRVDQVRNPGELDHASCLRVAQTAPSVAARVVSVRG